MIARRIKLPYVIHTGDMTHHHDHLMYPVSLSITNASVKFSTNDRFRSTLLSLFGAFISILHVTEEGHVTGYVLQVLYAGLFIHTFRIVYVCKKVSA